MKTNQKQLLLEKIHATFNKFATRTGQVIYPPPALSFNAPLIQELVIEAENVTKAVEDSGLDNDTLSIVSMRSV